MTENEVTFNKQIINKEFNEYKIKIITEIDSILILINQNNSNIFFQSKFNLTYLQSFKLLLPNFTIEEMVKFIISLIEQKNIKIETNKLTLKLILISSISNYPNIKLILNRIMTNQLVNNLMNEINNLKDENNNLSVNF